MFDIKKFLKAFILRSDLFAASTSLRYKGQPFYETICGGLFSIILVIFFIAIFSTKFIDLLNKVEVQAHTGIQIGLEDKRSIKNFTFAVGIFDIDFRDSQRLLDITLVSYEGQKGDIDQKMKQIQMAPCNRNKWAEYGKEIGSQFDNHQIETKLCPVNPDDVELSGFYGIKKQFKQIVIHVHGCFEKEGQQWKCLPQDEAELKFQQLESDIGYLQVELLVLDTLLAPIQDNYKIKRIRFQTLAGFSRSIGSVGIMQIGEYNITTDQSILPWQTKQVEHGYYVENYQSINVELKDIYSMIVITKSSKIQMITRKYDKIDDMLSYVGGLFALLFTFVVFFVGPYAEYKYELAVAQNAFTLDESGKKYQQKDFHFFKYIKYVCYDWLAFFGCNVRWKEMELIHTVREQATEQMDIRLVIKKFERLQSIVQLLMEQRNLICAQLTEPQTLDHIKKLRKVTQYCDRVLMHKYKHKSSSQTPIMSDMRLKDQQQSGEDAEIPSDFDEQDIEVEKIIIESYQELINDYYIDPVEEKVIEKIPKKMKNRLDKLSNQQYYNKALQRGPYKKSSAKKEKQLKGKKTKKKKSKQSKESKEQLNDD